MTKTIETFKILEIPHLINEIKGFFKSKFTEYSSIVAKPSSNSLVSAYNVGKTVEQFRIITVEL